MTLNDVMDYAKFYNGKNEPPIFHHEYIDLKDKLFIATDDFKLAQQLTDNTRKNVILHYFEYDFKQNRLLKNNLADRQLHEKVYAVTSPDFSVDSNNCWSCFNEGNILKSRICAYRWQSEQGEPVILTWQWGSDPATYKWAFENVEKGSIAAVSSQGVQDMATFENGIRYGIDKIQPDYICWYGKVFDFMDKYYDLHRIIKMQKRSELIKQYKTKINLDNNSALFNIA